MAFNYYHQYTIVEKTVKCIALHYTNFQNFTNIRISIQYKKGKGIYSSAAGVVLIKYIIDTYIVKLQCKNPFRKAFCGILNIKLDFDKLTY